MSNREQHNISELLITGKEQKKVLILFNDDVNNFDFVIDSLMLVCSHSNEQASQCALVAHTRGKCDVKHGDYEQLKSMKDALILRGLNATIK